MLKKIKHFARRLARIASFAGERSYSQSGEDMILRLAFCSLGIYRPRYLDVGAHHPTLLNNTAFFYRLGACGVNVEPNAVLAQRFHSARPKDINLNIGVSDAAGVLDFYLMSNPELSTFCPEQADRLVRMRACKIERIEKIKVEPVNHVVSQYFPNNGLEFLSLDTENFDLRILRSLDFSRHAPIAICVETIQFATDGTSGKNREIELFLKDHDYFVYADTHINTIFFHSSRFRELKSAMIGS